DRPPGDILVFLILGDFGVPFDLDSGRSFRHPMRPALIDGADFFQVAHYPGKVFEVAPEAVNVFDRTIDRDGFLNLELALAQGFLDGIRPGSGIDAESLVYQAPPQGAAQKQLASSQRKQGARPGAPADPVEKEAGAQRCGNPALRFADIDRESFLSLDLVRLLRRGMGSVNIHRHFGAIHFLISWFEFYPHPPRAHIDLGGAMGVESRSGFR